MANPMFVNHFQSLQDLLRDNFRARSSLLRVFDVSTKVSTLHVLHGDKDVALILVPAKELNE